MAERLTSYVSSPNALRFMPPAPGTADYELWMDGQEPDVQVFGATEEKLAPNYSDWLHARSQPKER